MKNFDDFPEILSRKQFMDLTEWSKSTAWRYTKEGGKLSHIKITVLGENNPPLFDKNKLRAYFDTGNNEGQIRFQILSFHSVGKDASNPIGPYVNGSGGGDHGQSL